MCIALLDYWLDYDNKLLTLHFFLPLSSPQAQGKKRVDAIAGFLDRAYTELSPMGKYVAVNVLAFTPFVQDDIPCPDGQQA